MGRIYIVPKRRFQTTLRREITQKTAWTTRPLKLGPIRSPETSVSNHTTPRKNPEDFVNSLILEDGNDTQSRNVGFKPLYAVQ
jgi:hypothetical protein